MASGSDPALNISITSTSDVSGFTKTEAAAKELADQVGQTSRIIDATGATPASAEQLAAMYMRDAAAAAEFAGRSKLATDATHALEVETISATGTGNSYAAVLNVIGRSLGGIIGRDLTKDVGIEGVGRAIEPVLGRSLASLAGGGAGAAGAVTSEGAAAAAAAPLFTALGLAIGGAVAAGAALAVGGVVLTNALEAQTKSAKEAGEAFDDFIRSRNKAIINAPTTKDAALDANVKTYQQIDELQARITAGTTKYAVNLSGEVGGAITEVIKLTKDAQDATDKLTLVQAKLVTSYKEAASVRDNRPSDDKELEAVLKVQQQFNQAALDAASPVQQVAQSAKNLAEYIAKGKQYLLDIQGNARPPQALVEAVSDADDFNALIPQVEAGARRMVAGFADGAQKLTKTAKDYADALKKVNDDENEAQAKASASITEEKNKLSDLGVQQTQIQTVLALKGQEVTKSKNAGTEAVLRGIAASSQDAKINEEIGKTIQKILDNQLLIEASKKRQADMAAEQKAITDKQNYDNLNQLSKDKLDANNAEIASNKKALSDYANSGGNDPDFEARFVARQDFLKSQNLGITSGRAPLEGPTFDPAEQAQVLSAGGNAAGKAFDTTGLTTAVSNALGPNSPVQTGIDKVAQNISDNVPGITTAVSGLGANITALITLFTGITSTIGNQQQQIVSLQTQVSSLQQASNQ